MNSELTATQRQRLHDALGEAQRIGMLGAGSVDRIIDHSLRFVRRIPDGTQTLVDLGSGGGDPGLVIAETCANLHIVLVERRRTRADFLVRVVGRLGLSNRVQVWTEDVADLGRLHPDRRWDVVTARGFGTPAYTARHAIPLMAPGGHLIVSEPPNSHGERWQGPDIQRIGLILESVDDGIATIVRS